MVSSRVLAVFLLLIAPMASRAHAGARPEQRAVVAGVYTVPTFDPVLAAAASTPVDSVTWRTRGNEVTLSYHLPEPLVGAARTEVDMAGTVLPGGSVLLAGELGTAACTSAPSTTTPSNTKITCVEIMPALTVDFAAVELSLATSGGDPSLVARQLEVARAFAHEPIGVVEFEVSF